ncbi:uncharacterized protein [Henckelia pumila]|uniref:uncharacterized protein n=1 Tax=Henckelia pumila TaxID=405737 RepID=UPI003C6E82E2
MVTLCDSAFLAIFTIVIQFYVATAAPPYNDYYSPTLPPLFGLYLIFFLNPLGYQKVSYRNFMQSKFRMSGGNPCEGNVCGRGSCFVTDNSTFGYECECEDGWRQARYEQDNGGFLKFLPCVVPNCTINYGCENTPTPELDNRQRERQANLSIFESCFWTNCGGGYCNQTSPFTHSCECEEGYYNLLNSTIFPCFRDCSFGAGCSNFAFNFTNTSNIPSHLPAIDLFDHTSHVGTLIPSVGFTRLIIVVTGLAWLYGIN